MIRFSSALKFLFGGCVVASALLAAASAAPVYELRTYTAAPGKGEAVLGRFREHTDKLFQRHGITSVGYWVAADEKDGGNNTLVYLLEFKDREAAKATKAAFAADPEWKAVVLRTEANGKIVAKAQSVFMTPTDFASPMTSGNRNGAPRLFELRTYVAAEGKLAALDARFRDHTVALFKKHGMTNLGYFHPLDADKGAGSTLIYFLAHANADAAAKSWAAFRADPKWVAARTASEKDGKLTGKVESIYLRPADFSKIK